MTRIFAAGLLVASVALVSGDGLAQRRRPAPRTRTNAGSVAPALVEACWHRGDAPEKAMVDVAFRVAGAAVARSFVAPLREAPLAVASALRSGIAACCLRPARADRMTGECGAGTTRRALSMPSGRAAATARLLGGWTRAGAGRGDAR